MAAGDVRKLATIRVDSGSILSWILLRSVVPSGASADCDYLIVSMYPGIPPHPVDLDELDAALKKAGIAMTAQQYVDRRNSLTLSSPTTYFRTRPSSEPTKKAINSL